MLRSLKEVQADDSVIGFYQATTLGAFFNQTLVDTQAIHQEKLRHGGIVVVHGEYITGVRNRHCSFFKIYPRQIYHRLHAGMLRSGCTD